MPDVTPLPLLCNSGVTLVAGIPLVSLNCLSSVWFHSGGWCHFSATLVSLHCHSSVWCHSEVCVTPVPLWCLCHSSATTVSGVTPHSGVTRGNPPAHSSVTPVPPSPPPHSGVILVSHWFPLLLMRCPSGVTPVPPHSGVTPMSLQCHSGVTPVLVLLWCLVTSVIK